MSYAITLRYMLLIKSQNVVDHHLKFAMNEKEERQKKKGETKNV